MELALDELAKAEGRPPLEVARDIADPLVDKQEYRTRPPTPSGTIPLPMAVRAFSGISDLLAAARRSLDEGATPSFKGRRPAEVTAFLSDVLLDTTAPGSYIMTVRVPLQLSDRNSDDPLGRKVVTRLHQAIDAAHRAATRVVDEGAAIDVFDSTIEYGVTQQLCEGLLELAGPEKNRPFDVRFSWARRLPSELPTQSIGFTAEAIRVIDSGAKRLKEIASSGKATITGKIREMHYAPAPHRVRVQGSLVRGSGGGEEATIWVRLDPEQYERASREHQNPQLTFQFTGHLTRVERRVEMLITREGYVTLERS
ncbi:hypothetical protein LWC34_45260 [Kibdelosporangium philippinense]|uniref:Uncharacterized protein n=1 Tax=Kibdelosporangium philippinense TaxID=211113 RepID=A0ABS8ZQW8_9PSEU|nr:hypothetical protein [Kibdelosporangium philippinense]